MHRGKGWTGGFAHVEAWKKKVRSIVNIRDSAKYANFLERRRNSVIM